MKVLGLDLSLTSTGLVLVENGKVIKHFAAKTTNKLPWFVRVSFIESKVIEFAKEADAVYMENYAFSSRFSREALGELGGIVKKALMSMDKPPKLVAPTQVKLFATGKGITPPCPEGEAKSTWAKKWVMQNVKENFGQAFNTDDETDAFVIATIGETVELVKFKVMSLEKLPKHQKAVVKKLVLEEETHGGKSNSQGSSSKQPGKRRRSNR